MFNVVSTVFGKSVTFTKKYYLRRSLKTIGHHTCLLNGDIADILRNAPFLAEDKPVEGKMQFLGTGFYFWDNNLEMAKAWGRCHYGGSYAIIGVDFDLKSSVCYDLVGNRTHQIDLTKRLESLSESSGSDKPKKWTLGQFFSFMQKVAKDDCSVFPYKMVRAIDLLKHKEFKKKQVLINFVEGKKNYTLLNPKIVICVFDKNILNLQTKKIIFTSC